MVNIIETIMEEKGTPTLKAIAAVFDLKPVRLYSVAKQPKEGEVYDAHVYNWDAIERFINRRLDADKGLGTLEEVIAKALELDEELKLQDGRRAGNRGGGNYGAKIVVDGKEIAQRRYESFEMENDQFICLKKEADVYKIIYQTPSHTVLRAVKADGEFANSDVRVISNFMLNLKGVGPSALEKEVATRFEAMTEAAE